MTADHSRVAELAVELKQLPNSLDAQISLQEFHDLLVTNGASGNLSRNDDVILLLYKSVAKDLLDRVFAEDDLNRHSLADAVDQLLGSFKLVPSFVRNGRAQDLWYERMHRYAAAYRSLTSPTTTWEARVQGIDFIVDDERQLADDPTFRMRPSLDQVLTNDELREQILGWYRERVGRALRHNSNGSDSSLCFVGRAPMESFPIDAFTLMAPLGRQFPASTLLTFRRDKGVELVDADSPPPKQGGLTVLIGDATDTGGTFGSAASNLREQYEQEVKAGFAIYDFAAGATQFLEEQGIELHAYFSRSGMAESLLEVYQAGTSNLHIDSKLSQTYNQSIVLPKFSPFDRTDLSHPLQEVGSWDSRAEVRSLREHGDAIVDELVSQLQMLEFRDPLRKLVSSLDDLSIPGLRGVAFATWESHQNPAQLSVHPLIDRSALVEAQFKLTQEMLDGLDDKLNDELEAQLTPHSCDFSLIDTKGEDIAMAIDRFMEHLEEDQRAFSMLAPDIVDDEQISLFTVATVAHFE